MVDFRRSGRGGWHRRLQPGQATSVTLVACPAGTTVVPAAKLSALQGMSEPAIGPASQESGPPRDDQGVGLTAIMQSNDNNPLDV